MFTPAIIFESSGTIGAGKSMHMVKDITVYKKSFINAFESFYGRVSDWCIIGLLPSYLERKNASLVRMVDEMIKLSHHQGSGFYLSEHDQLHSLLQELEKQKQPTVLMGVTFALLDFADKYPMKLNHTIVMETGGMKGRGEEVTREELHVILKGRLGLERVHSEYGMTELLSQAYSQGSGIFHCPAWMKVLIRDEDDPLHVQGCEKILNKQQGISGALNIIDLANIYSCSFIATDDAGKLYADGSFEMMGRMDDSDVRGCSLMVM